MLKKIKSKAEKYKNYLRRKDFNSVTMCKKCYTFYYKNSWHFEQPDYLEKDTDREVSVRFVECPACLEQEVASYESEGSLAFG